MNAKNKFNYEKFFQSLGWDAQSIDQLALKAAGCLADISRIPAHNVSGRMEALRSLDSLTKCIAEKILESGK